MWHCSKEAPFSSSMDGKFYHSLFCIYYRFYLGQHFNTFFFRRRRGKPKARVVWLTSDLKFIRWRPPGNSRGIGKNRSIPVSEITEVILGAASQIFQRSKTVKDFCAFSVVADRTLDLEVQHGDFNSEESMNLCELERGRWAKAFGSFIKDQSLSRDSTKQRRVSELLNHRY